MASELRQLTAVLFADIAGYTSIMQRDENAALSIMTRFQTVLNRLVPSFDGHIIQFYGDGCLVTFDNVKNAVNCAVEMQKEFIEAPQTPVRMGLHLGDVVHRDDNVFGDSVNIASRVESMGVPGAVLISETIQQQIRNQESLPTKSLGKYDFKNVDYPIEVFAVSQPGLNIPDKKHVKGKFAPKRKSRVAPLMIVTLLVLVIAYFATRDKQSGLTAEEYQTLGILPFTIDMSNEDLAYLAKGIPENLINRLSTSPDLKVLSRNSTFELESGANNMQELRKVLPADVILTGTLNVIQDMIILSCQLSDLSTGAQIWGTNIRQPRGDIFALEDSIVNALESPLRISVQSGGKEHIPPPEAYTHYLKGRLLLYGSSTEEADLALSHFRKAVEIDPDYALAYAGIAKVKYVAAMFGNHTSGDLVGEARSATQKAIQLEPDLIEAHLAEANIRFYLEHDWARAEKAFKEAQRIDPRHVDLNIEFAYFQNMMGRYTEARELADKALELDPISTASLHMAAWTRLFTDEYAEASELLMKALELSPNWAWGWLKCGVAEALNGDCEKGREYAVRANELVDGWGSELIQAYIGITLAHCGDQDGANDAYNRMMSHADTAGVQSPFAYMAISAGLRNKEDMMKYARRGVNERTVACYAMRTIPKLAIYPADMFDSPEFESLVESLNYPKD